MSSTCAIYYRYSSEQQRNSISIEAQRRACLEFAEKHGWRLVKICVGSVSEPAEGFGDPTDVLLESMLEGVAEYYSLNLLEHLALTKG